MSYLIKLKSTKFGFGWGSTSDPAGGAYSAPQAPRGYSLRGPTCKEREGKEGRGEMEWRGAGGGWPPFQIPESPLATAVCTNNKKA